MTPAQLAILKAAIVADATLNAFPANSDGAFGIAAALNLPAVPDFWVWRTNVTRVEIYNAISPDATTWDWAIYKAQSVADQNAWTQMFMGDEANFSQPNLRAGIGKIFGVANVQTLHALAMGRRKATRIEKVLAVGTGSAVVPAVMGFEGVLQYQDVEQARAS